MDIKKIKENLAKISILILNVILAIGGIFYFKGKDQQKKDNEIEKEKAYNEEVAKYEIDKIQGALEEIKAQKEAEIANNTGTVSSQKTEIVKKTYPAVTKQTTIQKPTKSTSSS